MADDFAFRQGRIRPSNLGVKEYTSGNLVHDDSTASHVLNVRLGTNKKPSSRQTNVINSLDKAVEDSRPLKKDTTLYKGATKDFIKGDRKPVKSFVSASDNEGEASNYATRVMYKISVPRGTKVIKTSEHSHNSFLAEGEHILPRNSKFKRGKEYDHPELPGTRVVELKHIKGK